jgi:hypothetical protein
MRLSSFMAALIFLLGAALMFAVLAHAGDEKPCIVANIPDSTVKDDLGGIESIKTPDASTHDTALSVKEEPEMYTPSNNIDMYMLVLPRKDGHLQGWHPPAAVNGDSKLVFIDTKHLGNTDRSLSELFGYTKDCNNQLNDYMHRDPSWTQDMPQDALKSNFLKALKEGLHNVFKIDPKFNPFLWRQLMDTQLGNCTLGLDARIGNTMYVSPKITWRLRFYGIPLDTELKWVPILRAANSNTSSYFLFRFNSNF